MARVLTTRLNDGRTVLAKQTPYGVYAVTYANWAQAEHRCRAIMAAGIVAHVSAGHPKYVVVEERNPGNGTPEAFEAMREALRRAANHLIMSGTVCNDAPEALAQARAALALADRVAKGEGS